ncbi:oxygenase MpaB family protein [Gordonia sp. VNQ95]|jgi:uncharacterized protein (DUF2236 family)|uniref:oxygenase MpaB family protein n=1 Tax=Gordonia TaxID=2053 RepID=UPI0032B4CACA
MATTYLPDLDETTAVLTNAQTRIAIPRRRRHAIGRHTTAKVTEALDFWSFAGAAANVIMQLSWPEVAYGVLESKVESGALQHHPWKRARTTTQYLAVAILGTDEERAAFRAAVNTAHRHVRSDENSPVRYNAFNRELQMWVAACLFVGVEDSYQLIHGTMDETQAEEFYQSSKVLGTTLQVPEEMWPASRAEFDHYWNVACERVSIDERTRAFLNDLVDLKMINPLVRLPFVDLLRFLTIGFLPPLFREELGVEWTATDRRRFAQLFWTVSVVNAPLPKSIRFGGSRAMMRDLRYRIRHDRAIV